MRKLFKLSILPLCVLGSTMPYFCSCQKIKYTTWKYSDGAFKNTIQPHEYELYNTPDAAYEAYVNAISSNHNILVEDFISWFSSIFYPQSKNNDGAYTFIQFGIKNINNKDMTLSFELKMQYDQTILASKYVREVWSCDNVTFCFLPNTNKPTLGINKNIYLQKDCSINWQIKYSSFKDEKKIDYWSVKSTSDTKTKSEHWNDISLLLFTSYYFQNIQITFPQNK